MLLFWLAGDWHWPAGWIFAGWFVAMCGSVVGWLYRKDPALLAERYRKPGSGGQSRRDQVIVYLIAVGFIVWLVIMPLDARRFGWTPVLPHAVAIAGLGLAMLALSWLLFLRACMDNTFLSPLVRIQSERQHQVVSTGVYGVVRHPMYLGALLMFVGAPLLLGALWALLVAGVLAIVLAVRIVGEEKLLIGELAGYDDYRRRVRYRLLPWVW